MNDQTVSMKDQFFLIGIAVVISSFLAFIFLGISWWVGGSDYFDRIEGATGVVVLSLMIACGAIVAFVCREMPADRDERKASPGGLAQI